MPAIGQPRQVAAGAGAGRYGLRGTYLSGSALPYFGHRFMERDFLPACGVDQNRKHGRNSRDLGQIGPAGQRNPTGFTRERPASARLGMPYCAVTA